MNRHLDPFELSEAIDARASVTAGAHLAACAHCTERAAAYRLLRAEAALLRHHAPDAPDPWALIAARTVHRRAVRRAVLRTLRVPLLVWTAIAFALGVIATEAVREASRRTAETSARVARPYR